MRRKVLIESLTESSLANERSNHANDRSTLGVRDRVKDLVDLGRVRDFDLDGMRRLERVELQRRAIHLEHKLLPDLVLGVERIDRDVFHVAGKAFVQPQVRPPLHGNEITKPLRR